MKTLSLLFLSVLMLSSFSCKSKGKKKRAAAAEMISVPVSVELPLQLSTASSFKAHLASAPGECKSKELYPQGITGVQASISLYAGDTGCLLVLDSLILSSREYFLDTTNDQGDWLGGYIDPYKHPFKASNGSLLFIRVDDNLSSPVRADNIIVFTFTGYGPSPDPIVLPKAKVTVTGAVVSGDLPINFTLESVSEGSVNALDSSLVDYTISFSCPSPFSTQIVLGQTEYLCEGINISDGSIYYSAGMASSLWADQSAAGIFSSLSAQEGAYPLSSATTPLVLGQSFNISMTLLIEPASSDLFPVVIFKNADSYQQFNFEQ